jgi:hypothetical protein
MYSAKASFQEAMPFKFCFFKLAFSRTEYLGRGTLAGNSPGAALFKVTVL